MSQILIAGDSWGCGEWNVECTEILHAGLEFYLQQDGHTVVNISKGGCSNLDIVHRLSTWLERYNSQQLDTVFIFQTEYTRDYKHFCNENDWQKITSLQELTDRWIERIYSRLSSIAQQYKLKIYIIGGCSDTKFFDNMQQDYPGCEIACQSLTNFLINNDPVIKTPVHSWYTKSTEDLIERVKLLTNDTAGILNELTNGFERESLIREHPDLFYPDGKHPNRIGYQKLYEFLKTLSII
jgi:lysophospholipase L1-like esterase